MPQPIVRQSKTRIISNVFLKNWLLDQVKISIESPLSVKILKHNLVKIIKFLKISYKSGIQLVVSDADQLILSEVSKKNYLQHERKMKGRFTTNNKNIIILLKSFKIKFYSRQEVYNKFGLLFKNNEQSLLQKYSVLEILEFEVFNRDEIIDNCTLPWIYDDGNYNVYEDEIISEEIDPFPIF